MPGLIIRALPWLVTGYGISKVDDVSKDIAKAVPWVAAGLVAFVLIKGAGK